MKFHAALNSKPPGEAIRWFLSKHKTSPTILLQFWVIQKICTYDYGLAQLFLWSEVLHTYLKSIHKVLRHFFLQTNQLYWILKRILSSNKCIMHNHKFNEVRLRQNVTSDQILQFLACSCISIIQVVNQKIKPPQGTNSIWPELLFSCIKAW